MFGWFFLLLYAQNVTGFGYDSGGEQASCGRPYRSGRMHQPPCDLLKQGFCTSAGSSYPWHAVRRFVKDNQGLMRRMYGDQRHSQVLKAEIEDAADDWLAQSRFSRYQHQEDIDNDVFPYQDEHETPRFLKEDVTNEDVLKTKFVFSEEPVISIKLAALKTAPYFRPTTQKSTSTEDYVTTESEVTTEAVTESSSVTTATITEESFSTVGETESSKIGDDKKDDNVETVLFQDMENEESKKKVHVNYKIKGINACPVKEEVVAPFWANNTRGEVLALLNMYPFEQYVHWEKCTYEHRQMYCREGCRCEQQYRLHRLLAYDPNNECRGIFSDWFRFPSCCVCKCYDMPVEFRLTSRSPRFKRNFPDD